MKELLELNAGTPTEVARSWMAEGLSQHERDALREADADVVKCPCNVCAERMRKEADEADAWEEHMRKEALRDELPMDAIRVLDWIAKALVVTFFAGLIAICYHAWTSGAIERLVR